MAVPGGALRRGNRSKREGRKLLDPLSLLLPNHRRKPEQKGQRLLRCWLFEGSAGRCTCQGAARPPSAAAELLGAACSRNSLPEEPAHAACGLTEGSPGWKSNTSSANDRCGEAPRGCREPGMKRIK